MLILSALVFQLLLLIVAPLLLYAVGSTLLWRRLKPSVGYSWLLAFTLGVGMVVLFFILAFFFMVYHPMEPVATKE